MNKIRLRHNFFKESEFSSNVFTLFSGTLIAQVIPLAISPILTRMYTPESFGVLAFILGLTMIFVSFFNGRYDAAIIVPKESSEAFSLFKLAMYLPFIMAAIVCGILWVMPQEMIAAFGIEAYLLFIIPVLATLFTSYMAFDFVLNRKKLYKKMSKLVILRVLFVATFQIILGFLFDEGLVFGLVLGMLIVLIFGAISVYPHIKNQEASSMLTQTAKKYKNYPMYYMPHTFFNTLSNNIPMLLLPYLFTLSVAGFYMMALKVFYTPFSMLGTSIEKVFRKQIIDMLHDKKEIGSQVEKMLYKIVAVSLIPFALLVWWAPSIFSLVLGNIWTEVGIYVQILSPWIYMTFIVSVFIGIPIVLEEQKKSLVIEVVYFVLRTAGLVVGAVIYEDIYMALALYTLGGVVVVGYNLFWIYHLAQKTRTGRED